MSSRWVNYLVSEMTKHSSYINIINHRKFKSSGESEKVLSTIE